MASDIIEITESAALEAATTNGPLLGRVCTWRLGTLNVSQHELEMLLSVYNLQQWLPANPSPRVVLRRALVAWLKEKAHTAVLPGEEDEPSERFLIRPINESGSTDLVFALVGERVDWGQMALRHSTSLRIVLEKKSGAMRVTTTATGDITASQEAAFVEQSLLPYCTRYADLIQARDVSEMCRRMLAWHACFALRREGGVYFVPEPEIAPILDLQQVIQGLLRSHNVEGFFLCLGVPHEQNQRASLANAAHLDLIGDIDRLGDELDEALRAPETLRVSTLQRKLNDVCRMQARVGLYQDVLGMRADDVQARVSRIQQTVVSAMMG